MGVRRVYLVRHGESEKNTVEKWQVITARQYDAYLRWQTTAPLTEKGAQQVNETAAWLAQVLPAPDRLYADTMKRTEQTAALIGTRLRLAVTPSAKLNEVHTRGFPHWLPPLPLKTFVLLDRLALFIPWPHEPTWYSGLARARCLLRSLSGASRNPGYHDGGGPDTAPVVLVSHHLFIRLVVLYATLSRHWHVITSDVAPAGISIVERRWAQRDQARTIQAIKGA